MSTSFMAHRQIWQRTTEEQGFVQYLVENQEYFYEVSSNHPGLISEQLRVPED